MYRWAEWSDVFPDEQHGFRVIDQLSDTLSEANPPLYVAFVDFAKGFDSIDRALLFW